MSVLERFHEQTDGKAGLADACGSDENDVLGFGDEVELGEGAKLAARDTGLLFEGKRLEGPLLGKPSPFDSPGESGLLSMMPLRPEQANKERFVSELGFVGVSEILVEKLGDSLEMEVFEELFELVTSHRAARR